MVELLVVPLLKIAVVLNAVLVSVTFLVLMERKVIAWAQSRLGPIPPRPLPASLGRAGPVTGLQHAETWITVKTSVTCTDDHRRRMAREPPL